MVPFRHAKLKASERHQWVTSRGYIHFFYNVCVWYWRKLCLQWTLETVISVQSVSDTPPPAVISSKFWLYQILQNNEPFSTHLPHSDSELQKSISSITTADLFPQHGKTVLLLLHYTTRFSSRSQHKAFIRVFYRIRKNNTYIYSTRWPNLCQLCNEN